MPFRDRPRRTRQALVMGLIDRLSPMLGIKPVFQQNRSDGRMLFQDAEQFRSAIAPKAYDPDSASHWLIIHHDE
jgi:hypothetical protein